MPRSSIIHCLLPLSLFSLAACTSIPISSMPKLAGLKPETVDFMQVELAARVSDDYLVYKDGAVIALELRPPAPAEPISLNLVLQPIEEPNTRFLSRQEKRGRNIYRFRVDPADAERATQYRVDALAMRDRASGKNSMSLSATAGGCIREGSNPFQDLKFKVYLRTSADEDYFTFVKEQTIKIKTDGTKPGMPFCKPEDMQRVLQPPQ